MSSAHHLQHVLSADAMLTWVLYNPLHQLLCLIMSQINVSPLSVWMQRGQGFGIGVSTLLLFQDQSCHENLEFRVKHCLVALLDLCSLKNLLESTKTVGRSVQQVSECYDKYVHSSQGGSKIKMVRNLMVGKI